MAPEPVANQPERAGRALRLVAAALLLAAVITIVLIAAGAFDPQPIGARLRTDHPGTFEQSETGERVIPQDAPWPDDAPSERFSLRLTAAHAEGDLDSGYGLSLEGAGGRLVVAVSPLGYLAVREETAGGQPVYHIPWSTWPHVGRGEADNEIWLDVEAGDGRAAITAAVNREQLWRGETAWTPDRAGLWLAAFDGRAEVAFNSLEWYAADQR